MNERTKYSKVCPFCGATCSNYAPVNLFCDCRAKYYYFDKLWLDRNTGKRVADKEEANEKH